jgi:hypothetical protein
MNIGDERDLRAQLGVALDEVASRPLPLGSVIRQGRAVKIRRRVTAAIGVAVVIAAAVATPAVLHSLSQGPVVPATPTHYHVSVHAPGPGTPRGVIAYGRLNGTRWQAAGFWHSGQAYLCARVPPFISPLPSPLSVGCGENPLNTRRNGGDLMSSSLRGGYTFDIETDSVRADVAYVRVTLSNGQVLTLRPVAIFGPRYASYVAYATPSPLAVTEISAYSAHGELAYAVPFTRSPDWGVWMVRWLRPGQPALPRPVTYRIGTATPDGHYIPERAYVGPWGTCTRLFGDNTGFPGDSWCEPSTPDQLAARYVMRDWFTSAMSSDGWYVKLIVARPSVAYLDVFRTDGSSYRLRPVFVAGVDFFTITSTRDNRVARWAAYSAAGSWLGYGAP